MDKQTYIDKLNLMAMDIFRSRYSTTSTETWYDACERVVSNVCGGLIPQATQRQIVQHMYTQKYLPSGRYLANAGKNNTYSNCLALSVEDNREDWSMLLHNASLALLKGIGIGVEYTKVRPNGSSIATGGIASGSVSLMQMVNEIARHVQCGGLRRSAVLAQLAWYHKDVQEMINIKHLSEYQKEQRAKDYNYITPLDNTNISIRLDDAFFNQIDDNTSEAYKVFDKAFDSAIETAEPGFTINTGVYSNDIHTNACNEMRTDTPNALCNLASLNLAAIKTVEELKDVIYHATLFLMCGRKNSEMPYGSCSIPNIGLGIMGLHTWLIQRGYSYDVNDELVRWLETYKKYSDIFTLQHAMYLNVDIPKRVRTIQPTGTTSLLTGMYSNSFATSGIEPVFNKAYIRRWYRDGSIQKEYVLDIHTLLYDTNIEDSYSLASNLTGIEKRLRVLSTVQRYVDQSISVTINLPSYANEDTYKARLKAKVLEYLPKLRGISFYRDTARGLSPLTPVSVSEVLEANNTNISTDFNTCATGVCGI